MTLVHLSLSITVHQWGISLDLPHFHAVQSLYTCSQAIGNDSSLTPTAYSAGRQATLNPKSLRPGSAEVRDQALPSQGDSAVQANADLPWKFCQTCVSQCQDSREPSSPEEV